MYSSELVNVGDIILSTSGEICVVMFVTSTIFYFIFPNDARCGSQNVGKHYWKVIG